ncbi:MAG: alcohol dehydrogenase [Firmicutes bacterium HGW-Firmicutes-5]|nr:MAG: alcohol dehydrogenase [Firmicutes bacterium HGW-Firmicutes-5]
MSQDIVMDLRKFVAPEIIIGIDARLLIHRYLTHFNSKRPMIVTDAGVKDQPWFLELEDLIRSNSEDTIVFDDVTPNPRDYEAMMGAEIFLSHDCDLLIAVGGGSPIDCAKCISIVSTNGGHILNYEGVDEIKLPGPPLICIPSTSGTSADISQFAIIQDSQESVKRAIISKKVVPDLALIDPIPLMTMDKYLTACTGMDALTHAIEAFVSNAHSPLTDVHALEAISLIYNNIDKAMAEDRSLDTMYQMLLGSLQAGLAFSNASLGAVHAMAHSLGGLLDLPHGECNSILLEHVIALNFDAEVERYKAIAKQLDIQTHLLSDDDICEGILLKIRYMREKLNIPSSIKVTTLSSDIIDRLIVNAQNDPCMVTNPRILSTKELRSIYEQILRI